MKVDIWSDIRCPFCYIGKKKFENALEQFEHKDDVKVTWHSFELDPQMKTEKKKNIYDYLAERKGISLERSRAMHEHVTKLAHEAGLTFNFDKAVPASSFNAHRLLQLARLKGMDNAAEERLFKAYFEEGKDISDITVLTALAAEIGIDENEAGKMLNTRAYTDEVRYDESKARRIGINGVPFFIFNEKYGLSGAQEPGVFLEMLRDSWQEYEQEKKDTVKDGISCSIEDNKSGAC
jgi:predicted DsbA family dithiol-disulfide isomerase